MFLATWHKGLTLVFSKFKYWLLFFAVLVVSVFLYSVLTSISILSMLSPGALIDPVKVSLVSLIAFLTAVGFTIAVFQLTELRALSKGAKAGAIGTILGTFTTACTVCQPLWLVWLGLGSVSFFLTEYSIYVIIASIALLFYSINMGMSAVVEGCRVQKKEKKKG